MSKQGVQQYMDSYNKLDHESIRSLLTDDVEWIVPGAFRLQGKEAVLKEISDHAYDIPPQITVIRMTEEKDVVIAEGKVHAKHQGEDAVNLVFCDVFEFEDGRIRRLTSYLGPA